MPDVGALRCWMLEVLYWRLEVGYWKLDIGSRKEEGAKTAVKTKKAIK